MGDPLPIRPHALPSGAFLQTDSPSLERSLMESKARFGRVRPPARLSQSESSGADEEWLSPSADVTSPCAPTPLLHHRSAFEQAHSNRQRVPSHGNQPPSSSPRSPNAGSFFSSQARLTRRLLQNKGGRGRNRTFSESEARPKSSRTAGQRTRGLSETESRPPGDNISMSGAQCLAAEKVWFDKRRYDEAEKRFYEGANGPAPQQQQQVKTAAHQAKGRHPKRQHRNSSSHGDQELLSRIRSLEVENQSLHSAVDKLSAALQMLESRVALLEQPPAPAAGPGAQAKQAENADEDDLDLFGSEEEEDEEAARIKQERLDAYAAKKSKKAALIAKSSILLDVKPWDDETDMAKLEECVRSVQLDGLLWGASKLVPVGYGIKKLQINCVVEDDKVGTDILEEEITKFEELVQSVDVAAFNKI